MNECFYVVCLTNKNSMNEFIVFLCPVTCCAKLKIIINEKVINEEANGDADCPFVIDFYKAKRSRLARHPTDSERNIHNNQAQMNS